MPPEQISPRIAGAGLSNFLSSFVLLDAIVAQLFVLLKVFLKKTKNLGEFARERCIDTMQT